MKLLLLIFAFSCVNALWNKLEVTKCGGKNDTIVMNNMTITPIPMPIPGTITINGNVSINQNLNRTNVHLKMYRVTKVIWEIDIKIPCIGGIGSCSYDICDLIKTSDGLFCNFFPPGRDCDCPIHKGNYTTKNLKYNVPYLGGIASWFAEGNYKVQVTIEDVKTKRQIGCFNIKLALKKN